MRVAILAAVAAVSTPALAGQGTSYMPPGGTNAQGASGGVPTPGGSGGYPAQNYAYSPWNTARAIPARPDQVRVGYVVRSTGGATIGRVAYASGDVAVVESSRSALRLLIHAFGIEQHGLLLDMTPARFESLAAARGALR